VSSLLCSIGSSIVSGMDNADKVRENRLRRMADRQGYRLVKSRARDAHALTYGGYMLMNVQLNVASLGMPGPANRGYGADLDDVEEFLTGSKRRRTRGNK
jgi:hypothetical protein